LTSIRLFADSCCDLDKNVVDELGVKVLPLKVNIGEQIYSDRVDLFPGEFYKMINEADILPTTSQVNPAEFEVEFQKVLDESDDEVIYIAFSSGLSGTYESACIARDMLEPERITVIDSKSASLGYGLTVMRAAQAIAAGKSKEKIIEEIIDNINRMEHIFIVGNFEMLKRGGRVSATSAFIGNLLNIKVIAELKEGKIIPVEKVKGIKKARKKMLKIMGERGDDLPNQLIGIAHSADYKGALLIKQMIQDEFGCKNFVITEIGPVIGSHVGAGTYPVFFLKKK